MTRQRRENLTGLAIRDPTEDTGKGTEGTAPVRTWRDRKTGAAQYAVAEEAVTLVGYRMEQTAEAEVYKGVMVITTTPHPHQDGQRMRDGGQNCRDRGRLA